MRAWLSLALPTALALQAFAFGWDPARAATKVSFGQVSATATMWPGVVATKKGFFAANGVEMDTVSIGVSPGMQAVAAGSINIMHNTCNAVISFIESGGSGVHLSLVSMGIHPGVVVGKKGLKSASELKGKVVGAQVSTTNLAFVEKYFKDQVDIRSYKTTEQHDLDLTAGRLDAAFAAVTYWNDVIAKPEGKDIVIVGPAFSGDILGRVDHLKFTHVERVDLRQISATAFFHAQQHRLELVVVYPIAGQQPAQHPVRGTAIHLRQHVHEEFRLRAIVRGITVDLEETGQAPD